MLERLINEDQSGAEELFHEIVVEKSRNIYENLLAEEYEVEEATDEDEDEEVEEATDEDEDEDEEVSEDFDLDSFEVEADDPMGDMGGDETDELELDIEMGGDDMDMGDEGEEELEDRVVDIEDALDELKAEFEKMMGGEDDGEEMDMDADADMDMDADADMDDEGEDEEAEKEAVDPYDQVATMREYVEKVTAKMGDNGVQTKSTVAGKNDMGGTASNIARADTENGSEAGTAGGAVKGSALSDTSAKDMSTGNVNVPGGKASKSLKGQPGHGAEKKGSGESADNKQSTLRARK